jgi:hypothetical protein
MTQMACESNSAFTQLLDRNDAHNTSPNGEGIQPERMTGWAVSVITQGKNS